MTESEEELLFFETFSHDNSEVSTYFEQWVKPAASYNDKHGDSVWQICKGRVKLVQIRTYL